MISNAMPQGMTETLEFSLATSIVASAKDWSSGFVFVGPGHHKKRSGAGFTNILTMFLNARSLLE